MGGLIKLRTAAATKIYGGELRFEALLTTEILGELRVRYIFSYTHTQKCYCNLF